MKLLLWIVVAIPSQRPALPQREQALNLESVVDVIRDWLVLNVENVAIETAVGSETFVTNISRVVYKSGQNCNFEY